MELLFFECVQAQKDIDDIENGFSDPTSVFTRTLLNKGELLRVLAESYEMLSANELIDVPVNHIANHIMKRVKELNSDLSTTRIYDVLPAKYKYRQKNDDLQPDQDLSHSRDGNEDSSIYTDYEQENQPEILYYRDQIDLCKKIISHLKSERYITKTDTDNSPIIDFTEYEVDLIIRKTAQGFVSDAFDNRKSVSLNTIHLLLESFFTASNNYAAGLYISKLKKFGTQKKEQSFKIHKLFDPKQFTKILKGHTREIHQSFEILNQDDAYANGFYGKTNCPECGDWRVILSESYNPSTDSLSTPKLSCFNCGKMSEVPKVKLPLSQPTPHVN